jgi:hypothetical protein
MDTKMIKPGLWGLAIGVGATVLVGFSTMGWTGPKSAEQMAQQRADKAVVAALVPVCMAQSKADIDTAKLVKLASIQSPYDRRDFVMKAGWATMPLGESANGEVADACASALSKAAAG